MHSAFASLQAGGPGTPPLSCGNGQAPRRSLGSTRGSRWPGTRRGSRPAYRHDRSRRRCGGRRVRAYVDPQMARILADMAAAPVIDFKVMPIAEARALADAGTLPWSQGAPIIPAWEIEVPGAAGGKR